MDSGEEMRIIAKEMGIQPTPHTSKTDSYAVKIGTEVGWCDCGLLGMGEIDGT